jgi:hypothetical protein
MDNSQNDQLITAIINSCPFNLLQHLDKSSQLVNNPSLSQIPFSFDEKKSSTHITPFHLSFFTEPASLSKRKGQYFTPSYISVFMVRKSLIHLFRLKSNITELIFGDIACGSGNLLIPLLEELKHKTTKEMGKDEFLKLISTNFYGFDIDSISLWIARTRILFFLSNLFPDFSPKNVKLNLYNSDALKPLKINKKKEIEDSFFDLIVLNPPYMNYGLRNAQKFDKEFRKTLRARFYSAEYKLSLYPIFMERSIELLNDDGILGIITPDSYLLGRYYSKIRSYLLQNTNVLDISLLGFEPFLGVTLGRPTISFLRKTKERNKSSFTARWIHSFSSFQENTGEEFQNFQSEFHSNFYNRFHLFFNREDKKFVKDWEKRSSKQIADIVSIHTGVRSKIGQKNIISHKQKSSTWKKGIISSSQVKPFFLDYQNHWININPTLLWSGGFDKKVNENPKLIMRQTGYQIVSCVDTDGYYHLNNCHSISPISTETNLYALATVLNSQDFNRFYHILSIEKGRTFAQMDIEFLLKLPILTFSYEVEKKLEQFYFQQNILAKKGEILLNVSLSDFL